MQMAILNKGQHNYSQRYSLASAVNSFDPASKILAT